MPAKEIPIETRYQAYKYMKAGYGLRETARKFNISAYGAAYNQQRIDETQVLKNRDYAVTCILQSPAVKIIDELLQGNPTITKNEIKEKKK
uniref:Transposase n=1 Tax=Panagrolaimus sp. ES5 TaxID=591445 RepID=A0AC34FMQ5_9BILA